MRYTSTSSWEIPILQKLFILGRLVFRISKIVRKIIIGFFGKDCGKKFRNINDFGELKAVVERSK